MGDMEKVLGGWFFKVIFKIDFREREEGLG